ncbi:hypothetical protein AGDE_12687 [Angomonas deanei]|uniref:Uncharacterized protein n=1 Tax=Angomonas deanei TaxID=59799 RepID=A0A7G2C7M9_9TRYP|nr:hypothetical protein AGDE_12687 [Angomonas deanei]CAD2215114.1 hypothetical protein, conserved [Angomonas deanei]|eukprot:EPY23993.1 hypothetical protein AGDE_12687 [Angomonas deanei]
MENVLLTRDAAYQYTRWSEAYRQFLRAQEKEEAAALLPHEAAIQAAIERLALPYIHNLLPHRRNEPCCTEGYCQPCAASSSELLDMHRLVHPGRPFLYLPPLRDEECACLAHSTAVLQVRRVQQVVLSGYKGGGLTDEGGYAVCCITCDRCGASCVCRAHSRRRGRRCWRRSRSIMLSRTRQVVL